MIDNKLVVDKFILRQMVFIMKMIVASMMIKRISECLLKNMSRKFFRKITTLLVFQT